MKKVRFKHREGSEQMSESSLRIWVEQGIEEGLGAFNIEDSLKKMFDIGKIRQVIIDSLVPEVMNAVTPYYREEFYSAISHSGDTIIISPWWDDCWQEIKVVDLVKKSTGNEDIEHLTRMRGAFAESLAIIDKEIKEVK